MLSEDNVRKGFFEYNEYKALYDALPDYLRPVLAFGYFLGWRAMEILNLKWSRLDLEQGKASLAHGETKNKESREIYLDADLLGELRVLEAKRNPLCPYVFQRDS
jgi:integrase